MAILSLIKKNWHIIAIIALMAVAVGLLIYTQNLEERIKRQLEEIEYIDTLGQYNKIYYESQFKILKKENRELYDSLKQYKDQIDYLVQFTYHNEYSTGQVNTPKGDSTVVPSPEARTYTYEGELKDTFKYKLNVNSDIEPNWYSLNASIKETFTIVNKQDQDGGANHISIGTSNGGSIDNATVFKRKNKVKLKDMMAFGPSVTAGYDPFNNRPTAIIGVSCTIDLTKLKKNKKK